MSLVEKKNGLKHIALLPAGFKDQLPSMAAHEAFIVQAIIEQCEAYGYERIKPPLIEFEDSQKFGKRHQRKKKNHKVPPILPKRSPTWPQLGSQNRDKLAKKAIQNSIKT